ncbi:hypothetical protein [Micromonospora sp. CA-111912]|uniref:hypothetical protein n=1 Tax=Micromonospora sp. CA-111912 TaxID=3239955 RepID=UPI003D91CC33
MTTPPALSDWVPGLDDSATLAEAHAGMPGDDPSVVPWYVRLLENPASPVALPGNVDLFGHDSIHIILGRGTLPSDEAFVLGATMGSSGRLSRWQQKLFTLATSKLYRGPWRLGRDDLLLFEMAVRFAAHQSIQPLGDVPWRDLLSWPLGEIRAKLGIHPPDLLRFYATERALWPHSAAARRLPTSVAADHVCPDE